MGQARAVAGLTRTGTLDVDGVADLETQIDNDVAMLESGLEESWYGTMLCMFI